MSLPAASLLATLHLEATLPALATLAQHDTRLREAAAGPRAFAITLLTPGCPRPRRLAFTADGIITTSAAAEPGDLRVWFPTDGQFLRATRHKPALALPLAGWSSLRQLSRFQTASHRLDALLRVPETDPVLFAYGSLVVALAAACAWLRHAPAAPGHRARLGEGIVTFSCPAIPSPLWIDLGHLASGCGPAPRSPVAEVSFHNLDTLLAELTRSLDSLAALGGGELRIRGHLLIVERLSLVLDEVSHLLNPPAP